MDNYFCNICGYINEYACEPTFCVYCHNEAKCMQKYENSEKIEKILREAVDGYLKAPDPITKKHSDSDSSFRISLRHALLILSGREVQRDDAKTKADERVENGIEDAVKNYILDPCPVGTVYEEINSALARHYRRTLVSLSS